MQAVMILAKKLTIFGENQKVRPRSPDFGGNENSKLLEEKFDSGMLSLHVLSIP
jgi:hypothetical protein